MPDPSEMAHQMARQALPNLLQEAHGRKEIVGVALIEMLAILADMSGDPGRAKAVWIDTIRQRFAWSDEGGTS